MSLGFQRRPWSQTPSCMKWPGHGAGRAFCPESPQNSETQDAEEPVLSSLCRITARPRPTHTCGGAGLQGEKRLLPPGGSGLSTWQWGVLFLPLPPGPLLPSPHSPQPHWPSQCSSPLKRLLLALGASKQSKTSPQRSKERPFEIHFLEIPGFSSSQSALSGIGGGMLGPLYL